MVATMSHVLLITLTFLGLAVLPHIKGQDLDDFDDDGSGTQPTPSPLPECSYTDISPGTPRVIVTGIPMDNYCIKRGNLLDNPSFKTLQYPDKHSIHCLVDVPQCYNSKYAILRQLSPKSFYSIWYQLDTEGTQFVKKAGEAFRATQQKLDPSWSDSGGWQVTLAGYPTSDGYLRCVNASVKFSTKAPTSAPAPTTPAPSTKSPSRIPSWSVPTSSPSKSPSALPTAMPTVSTAMPTQAPLIKGKTHSPITSRPTHTPTTPNPTIYPSVFPSHIPSMAPTALPTRLPVSIPSDTPTYSPSSSNPTISPLPSQTLATSWDGKSSTMGTMVHPTGPRTTASPSTSPSVSPTIDTKSSSSSSSSDVGVIAGAVVGVLLLLIIVGALVFFFVIRGSNHGATKFTNSRHEIVAFDNPTYDDVDDLQNNSEI